MLKTIIVLPDGTELSSGVAAENVIQSVTITEWVNSSQELTLGSVCASALDAQIITPEGGLHIGAGDEVTVYKVDDNGQRQYVGLFSLEKPVRSSAASMKLSAYDRVTWLDRDLSAWLAGLNGWPYTLYTLARMVCNACGLLLANSSIPNGDYLVQAFSAQGITGRKLMQWIGEAAGRFCRATPDGKIEFAWYQPSGVSITPNGDRFYYQNGLTYEDYQVTPVEKVQIKLTQDDVGVVWPNDTGEKNTYVISGNYLLTTSSTAALLPVAQTLYEHLKGVTYTPCRVQLPASLDIHAGHTINVTDRNGRTFTSFVMTKTQTGQRDTLECTGSHRRDSTTVVNNQSLQALSGKMLEIQQSVEGFFVTASEIKGNAIYDTEEEFYSSTSPVALSGGSWSSKQPVWTEGRYIWLRSKVTKGDGTVTYTPSETGVCITGNTGAAGKDGTNGADGKDGTDGVDGTDGKTSYVHIKYSDDGTTFTDNDGETLGAWIGTLVDFNEEASLNFDDYTWKKFTEDVDDDLANLEQSIQQVRETTAKLEVDDESIRSSVSSLETTINTTKNEVIATKNEVASMNLQYNQLDVKIEKISNDGVNKVTTTTGFTFDDAGMQVDKSDSPTKTVVTPDGMNVYSKSGGEKEVLAATSEGVDATNLHAKTYLTVGGRSRFENYGSDRTGCYWIGG